MGLREERRSCRRFAPSGCRLEITPRGLILKLRGNRAFRLLDLSEGGFRAVVEERPAIGDRLTARLKIDRFGDEFGAVVETRNSEVVRTEDHGTIVGFKFLKMSPVLKVCIRRMLFDRLRNGAHGAEIEIPVEQLAVSR